jgi:hypothetical protein
VRGGLGQLLLQGALLLLLLLLLLVACGAALLGGADVEKALDGGPALDSRIVCCLLWAALACPATRTQVLEVAEHLLRSSDLLLDFSNRQLPASSQAGQFLGSLGQLLEQAPPLGSVVRCGVAHTLTRAMPACMLSCERGARPAPCACSPPRDVRRVQLPQLTVPLAMSPPKRIGSTHSEGPLPLLL